MDPLNIEELNRLLSELIHKNKNNKGELSNFSEIDRLTAISTILKIYQEVVII